MMSEKDVMEKYARYVMQTYTRQPIVLKEGKGAVVKDVNGKEYIDCVAGIAVNNVGHCHPRVVSAIKEQAEHLIHISNLYYNEPQAQLAEKIVELTPIDRVFFCNSGTEAVEAALKLARKASGKKEFIAAEGSFHGRTLGALSITYKEKYRKPFEPLIPGARFVPYNDVDAIQDTINNETAAVILEPIQGENGIRIPSEGYLGAVRDVCDEKDVLLILDEVQTGFGRTGKWFAYEHYGVEPDIITMAKALGGGFPMGAMCAKEDVARCFKAGDHASTFGGDPLACAAALGSIAAIEEENLVQRAEKVGAYFLQKLRDLRHEYVIEIRGKGLMIGIELSIDGNAIVDMAREKGVLLNCISDRIIRIVPPLVITEQQIDRVVEVLG